MADAAGDASTAGAAEANISSVYEQMGELDAAAEYAQRGAARLSGRDRARHLPKVLIHLASLRARQGRMEEATALFARGIDGADAAGDLDTYALGWDRLGEERFKRGELAPAEQAMLEAWRVRKLHRPAALGTSYRNLGRLRLAQGDLRSAAALLDEAVARARAPRGLMPTWDIYHARGLVRLAEGRPAEALADLRIAVRLARAWRAGVSPPDAMRVGGETMVEEVYTAWARAAAALYFQNPSHPLLAETFQAVEENRALSLRSLIAAGAGRRADLPPEYWEKLTRLQASEVALVRRPGDAVTLAEVERLRAEAAEIENRTTPVPAEPGSGLLARLEGALAPDAAYFSFQLREPESYLWAVDRSGACLRKLPGRAALAAAAVAFTAAVRENGPAAERSGRALYGTLFGGLPRRFTSRPRWLLALDDELFGMPLAALREGRGYLVERHSLQLVSAAGLVARAAPGAWRDRLRGPFVGVGDPIYNTADERWVAGAQRYFGFLQASSGTDGIQLPRLVGSGREIELCAAEWGGRETVLLKGAEAAKANLRKAMGAGPAVAHLATHVLQSAQRSRHGLIALSLRQGGEGEVLDPLEIAAWNGSAGLVTLSGCSSGAGQVLPGTGLMGLTRAWLASGAAAVAATRWPTPDGTGALLRALYRNLREYPEAGPAAALGRAQTEMLRAGGWRAQPRYWGAYFVVGNQ